MPEFKNKEEYEKWKGDRSKLGKDSQNKTSREIPVKASDVKVPPFTKKTLTWISLVIITVLIFGGGGYVGYKYYTSYREKKQQEIKRKADEAKYMLYLADAREVSKQIGSITSGLEVGYNYMEFTKRVADLNYAHSKFIEKYDKDPTKNYVSFMALFNAGANLRDAVRHWKYGIENDFVKFEHERMRQANFAAASLFLKLAEKIIDQKKMEMENNEENKAILKQINSDNAVEYQKFRGEVLKKYDQKNK